MNCPCHSGKNYESCCGPYHKGQTLPPTAETLMRSRYSAYALGLADYILETTHPENPQKSTKASIEAFCRATTFEDLKILATEESPPYAYVTFRAQLFQEGHDVSFTERSQFEQIDGRWLYLTATTHD